MNHQPILYVEDDQNEVFLLRHVFKETEIHNPLHVVTDGQQAMTYLAGTSRLCNGEANLFPSLVLLDLHLPGISGLEVLEWIRAQPALTTLVVIIFSSSQDPQELARAYRLRANSFVRKPPDLPSRLEFASMLKAWWLNANQVPARAPEDGSPPARSLVELEPSLPGRSRLNVTNGRAFKQDARVPLPR